MNYLNFFFRNRFYKVAAFAICIVLYVVWWQQEEKRGEVWMPTSKKKWWNVCFFSYKPTTICQKKCRHNIYDEFSRNNASRAGGLGESREEVKFHSAISLAEFLWLLVWNSLLLMKLWFPVELYTTYVPELFLRC